MGSLSESTGSGELFVHVRERRCSPLGVAESQPDDKMYQACDSRKQNYSALPR